MIRLALAFLIAAGAAPALAQTPAASTSAASAVVADGDRIVCRSERTTTTRFPVRTCRTKNEWKARESANRRSNERLTDSHMRIQPTDPDLKPAT
jgi:hypothetical protein